ncbi:unnamed protein product [Meloidogyne enterolobii]|uniref:Uncharacterized protein n=1 Tax=Meloidogyne enterolobii TaxID=390850 RepID=A0ACB1A8B9_MELEN
MASRLALNSTGLSLKSFLETKLLHMEANFVTHFVLQVHRVEFLLLGELMPMLFYEEIIFNWNIHINNTLNQML